METVVVADPAAVARHGAELVGDWLRRRPDALFVPALGTSPLGIYAALAAERAAGRLDTARLRVAQLDAYLGIAADDRRALRGWLRRAVLEPLAIPDERVIWLRGDAADPEAACRAYDAAVAAAGGIDVAVLGLGPNGHLGFNEPPSPADAPTRVVELTAASVASNARYWGGPDAVPRRALTAGMATLLRARRILLVVAGQPKRDVLRRLIVEPVSDDLPASHLRTVDGVTLLADRGAWPAELAAPAGR